MAEFVHLHCHSEYSLLDGLGKIPDLLKRAKELGMDSLAITDHGAMYGVFKFFVKAKDLGVKPIIGVEVYQAPRSRHDKQAGIDDSAYHLVLLAENFAGYQNLMKMVTHANLDGFYYKPRIDMQLLRDHSEGLICLSGCLSGEISQLLLTNQDEQAEKRAREFMNMFGPDHYYLEIQHHPNIPEQEIVNKKIVALSRKLGLPLVATNDIHYIYEDDAEAQEVLLCVQTQHSILEANRPMSMIKSPDYYMRSPDEMKAIFAEYPEAISNTVKIAEMCNVEIPMGKFILPIFDVPEGETETTYLKNLTFERLKVINGAALSDDQVKRLEYELDIIKVKGYDSYFLIVADFVNWAKSKGIAVGPGRGSAAGSLVAYAMGITEVDPLANSLPFERFLNPDRPSPPDIDLDFADIRREEVIQYVTDKYGVDHVAQLITFGTMEARAAVRDVGRVLGMPYSQPDRIAKLIPPGAQGSHMSITKALEITPELAEAYNNEPETKRLIDLARKLEGVARHASVHAAGLIISDKPLPNYVPLQRESKGDRIVTQYDMYCIDLNAADGKGVGLLKMDLLGLRNLTIMENAIEFIKKTRDETVNLRTISLEDKEAYELISSGETTGIFQMESAGMRRLAKDLKPGKFSDIAAMVALFRPGPMEWIPQFIQAKENPRKIKYLHPRLRLALGETYGIAVYQEQCMQIATLMAGYNMVEADKLRMAIGKKKIEKMVIEKKKFIKGCIHEGHSQELAEKLFALIESFVGYGFNKAHSACYALVAYQTAYLKAKYPVEFMTAVLTAESRGASGPIRDEKINQVAQECLRMKIPLLPPDINHSETDFSIEQTGGTAGNIRFGLTAVKNVGTAAIESILSTRQKEGNFTSFTNFIQRVDLSKVNRKTIESLIKTGAFDAFGTRSSMLASYSQMVDRVHQKKSRETEGQASLFAFEEDFEAQDTFPQLEELSRTELMAFEKELLGFYLTHHPLTPFLPIIEKKATMRLGSLIPDKKKFVIVGGVITQVKKIFTKANNAEMLFVRLDDSTGSAEVIVFPTIFARTKQIWKQDHTVLVKGKVTEKDERISILVDDARLLDLSHVTP